MEVYLRMTDEDFEYLMSINSGDDVLNPFQSSVLVYGEIVVEEDEEEDESDVDTLSDLDAETFDE